MTAENPLMTLVEWVAMERTLGTPFAHGAVLGTQGAEGMPRTRMLGVYFDAQGTPRFHTSPVSRKVGDIGANNAASLTFGFQRSMRSVSLEGYLSPLPRDRLVEDWGRLEPEFRRNYLVFGRQTGKTIRNLDELRAQQSRLPADAEAVCPDSFIGYCFGAVTRIAFYAVAENDFASHRLFERVPGGWHSRLIAP